MRSAIIAGIVAACRDLAFFLSRVPSLRVMNRTPIIRIAGETRASLLGRLIFEGFAVAALVAVVAVPAASAKTAAPVRLSLLPLPAAALGPAARSLPLEADSGNVTARDNDCGRGCVQHFVVEASPVVPNTPSHGPLAFVHAKVGLMTGYGLDYGDAESGGTGVTQVWTRVREYKTSADATKGLVFWRQWDARSLRPGSIHANHTSFPRVSGDFAGSGLLITVKKKTVAAVGHGRFAVLVGYRAANIAPLFGLDEQFTEGRYVADVTVWAGNAGAASRLAPRLATRLDARIKQALAGRLHAKPVKLPPTPEAGPPPGGPDLATLALKPTDLSGDATADPGTYVSDPFSFALSLYGEALQPAGPFDYISQWMSWYPTANEASFEFDFSTTGFNQHPLDLCGLGDGARGFLLNTGVGLNTALLDFHSGRLLEGVAIQNLSTIPIQPSQVESIGQTVANYINADGLGS
jgi:hypothetical protein